MVKDYSGDNDGHIRGSAQNWFNVQRSDDGEEYAHKVTENIASAPVSISGTLAETMITLDDLKHLSVGDLIVTEKPASRPVVLCVEDERKFLAQIGQYRGNRALSIQRPIIATDRV